jgi:hypothetical protein
MYKTAIARIEGKSSYDEALNSFRVSYPAYEVRGLKQSNNGWIAFIQKSAFEDEEVSEDVPMLEEDETLSPGADEEGSEYEQMEDHQGELLEKLEQMMGEVAALVSEIKSSEENEEEVRPGSEHEEYESPEEEVEEHEEGPLDLEREKEDGLTLASATKEIEELVGSDPAFRGYKVASVSETRTSYIAKLKK